MKIDIQRFMENPYIQKKHNGELVLFLYTRDCQYEQKWSEDTLMSRGLVTDKEGNVVALPFTKFFNYEEFEEKPIAPYTVQEKMDGSLGILYYYNGEWRMNTKGSFDTEQSRKGFTIIKAQEDLNQLDKGITYLFEIIYPENQIVIRYDKEMCVFLGAYDNETGMEVCPTYKFKYYPKDYGVVNEKTLLEMQEKGEIDKEGFVCKDRDGNRFKIKFQDYIEKHRVCTGVTDIMIWELMLNKEEIPTDVPDELYKWIDDIKNEFMKEEKKIWANVGLMLSMIKKYETRKDLAAFLNANKYGPIVFAVIDGKDARELVYRSFKPQNKRKFFT